MREKSCRGGATDARSARRTGPLMRRQFVMEIPPLNEYLAGAEQLRNRRAAGQTGSWTAQREAIDRRAAGAILRPHLQCPKREAVQKKVRKKTRRVFKCKRQTETTRLAPHLPRQWRMEQWVGKERDWTLGTLGRPDTWETGPAKKAFWLMSGSCICDLQRSNGPAKLPQAPASPFFPFHLAYLVPASFLP